MKFTPTHLTLPSVKVRRCLGIAVMVLLKGRIPCVELDLSNPISEMAPKMNNVPSMKQIILHIAL